MRAVRSRIHMLTVAAARLEQEHANPKLIADLREAAERMAAARAEGHFIENGETQAPRAYNAPDITEEEP